MSEPHPKLSYNLKLVLRKGVFKSVPGDSHLQSGLRTTGLLHTHTQKGLGYIKVKQISI